MLERLTRSELARRWKVSKPMMTKYVSRGLPIEQDGKIAVDVAESWRADNIVRARSFNPKVAGREITAAEVIPPDAPEPAIDNTGTMAEALRVDAWEKVRERRLKNRKMEGELVDITAINAYVAGMIMTAREQLMRIGAELRDALAVETDAIRIQEAIDKRIERALGVLAEYRRAA